MLKPKFFSIYTLSLSNLQILYALMLKQDKLALLTCDEDEDQKPKFSIMIYNINTSTIEHEYELPFYTRSFYQLDNGYILTNSFTMKVLDISTSPIRMYEITNEEQNNVLEDFTVLINQDIAIIRTKGLIDIYSSEYPFEKKWSINPKISKKKNDSYGCRIKYLKLSNILFCAYGHHSEIYSSICLIDLKAKQCTAIINDYICIFTDDLIELSNTYILLPIYDLQNYYYTIVNLRTCTFEQKFPSFYREKMSLNIFPFIVNKDYVYQIEEINKDFPVIESYSKYPFDNDKQLIICKTKDSCHIISQNNDKFICFIYRMKNLIFVRINNNI